MAAAPQSQIGWSARRQADTLVSDLLLPDEILKVREEARTFAESVLRPAAYSLNTTPEQRDGFRHDIFKASTLLATLSRFAAAMGLCGAWQVMMRRGHSSQFTATPRLAKFTRAPTKFRSGSLPAKSSAGT